LNYTRGGEMIPQPAVTVRLALDQTAAAPTA